MGMTPNSNSSSYLSASDFLFRKDVRAVGQLAVDDGTEATSADLQDTRTTAGANLAAILKQASGEVEAELVASQRYSTDDLASANGVSSEFLKGIIADIAMYKLFGRRDAPGPPEIVVDQYDKALEKLLKLSRGDIVLSFSEAEDAGVASSQNMTNPQIKSLNLLSDNCSRALGIRNYYRRNSF